MRKFIGKIRETKSRKYIWSGIIMEVEARSLKDAKKKFKKMMTKNLFSIPEKKISNIPLKVFVKPENFMVGVYLE